jgi:MFS family permease
MTAATAYASEMAPLAIRGGIAAGINLALALGQLLVYAVLRETGSYPDDRSYKYLFASQWGFVGLAIVLLPFFVESPYLLIAHGKADKAEANIRKLYGKDYDVEGHMASIQYNLAQETEADKTKGGFVDCFSKTNWKRTLVACSVFFISNCSGIVWVVGYMSCKLSHLFHL